MQWNRKLCGLRRRKSHQAVTHSAQWGGLWSPRNRPLFVSNSEVSPLQKETPLRIKFTNSLCWAKWWPKGYQLLIPGILPNSQVVLKQHLPHSPPVQFSCSVMSNSLRPHESQDTRPPKLMCIESVMPSSHLILCNPLFLLPPIPPNIRVFSNKSTLRMRWPSTGVSSSASVLQMNTQDWSPLEWTGWSPCSPRDSQESSPTPQFKSINSLALSFLHSPTPTSIHDHWKNHSLDEMDLCWQSNVSAFEYAI